MLTELGVLVTPFPYEIHPDFPPEGLTFEERWRSAPAAGEAIYSRVEAECEAVGLPFRRPARIPNTRRALETAAYVRQEAPDAFPALDRSLFDAHFVDGRFLGDQEVLDELVAAAGADPLEVRRAVDAGEMAEGVDSSMIVAREIGIDGTPTWLIDGRTLVPGVHPRDHYRTVVGDPPPVSRT
ncbi:MAG: DsbA family protein [Actinomycetota bacterium]|nr:DsbA family protein [Actinomycetota bacterium]